jgi:hypothetical protein
MRPDRGFRREGRGVTMRRKGRIETTLGNLILLLTEEAAPFVREPEKTYRYVSYVLNDLIRRGVVQFKGRKKR